MEVITQRLSDPHGENESGRGRRKRGTTFAWRRVAVELRHSPGELLLGFHDGFVGDQWPR
ncbi:hypothetical protein [Amycolatopsis magusensis]|uniref:hypothetical protein n=1 Tax=Amycolatopsis magusensis TaxID=882444 RepID=UPI003C2C7164